MGIAYPVEQVSENKSNNLIHHMIQSYGGITTLVPSMMTAVKYIPKLKDNKVLSFIGKAATVSMVVYDFIEKIKEYYDEKHDNVEDHKNAYIDLVLGVDSDTEYSYSYNHNEITLTSDHIMWLLNPHNNPDTMGGIVIKSFHELTSGKDYKTIPEVQLFAVLVEFGESLLLIEIDQISVLDTKLYTFKKLWTGNQELAHLLGDVIHARYLDSVGFEKNIVNYDGLKINTRPRLHTIDFDISSINFNDLVDKISMTLDNGGRRGYLFTGNPGTGKTSVLLKLEHTLTQYPLIYVTSKNLNDEYSIDRLELFIRNIGKCVILIEDMDSLEIDRKTKKIAPLLSLLDNSRNISSVVFVATINDSSLITPSIARTGRFDEIIEIKEPSKNKEIYDIMAVAWKRSFKTTLEGKLSFITYMRLKMHKLTQSDYCEIIQKLYLNTLEFNDKNIINAMKELVKSKNTFKKYKCNYKE